MIRAAFVMEVHLGHSSFYQNLRSFIDQSHHIDAHWIPVTYNDPGSVWEKLPLLPNKIRGPIVGVSQIRKGLSKGAYDVAVFNTQVPAVLAGDLVGKQPYVISTDITPMQYDSMAAGYGHVPDRPGILARYKYQVNAQRFRGAARLLPWSNWVASSMARDYGVSQEQITVIPPGVNIDVWKPGKREAGNGPLRVLFVGGDFFRKGGDLLLEAFDQLPEGLVELVLVTRSPIKERKSVKVYNNMSANTPELIQLYQSCDVFVLPTKAEAFGLVAVEASATGLPVIATNVGALSEIVSDGETGFLLSPDSSAEELAERMRTFANDRQLLWRFREAARRKAETCFSAETNAQQFANILCEVAAR